MRLILKSGTLILIFSFVTLITKITQNPHSHRQPPQFVPKIDILTFLVLFRKDHWNPHFHRNTITLYASDHKLSIFTLSNHPHPHKQPPQTPCNPQKPATHTMILEILAISTDSLKQTFDQYIIANAHVVLKVWPLSKSLAPHYP